MRCSGWRVRAALEAINQRRFTTANFGSAKRVLEGRRQTEERLALFLFVFFRLQTGVTAGGEFGLEFFNASSGVDVLQFARIERMASGANVDANFFAGATSHKRVSTATSDFGLMIPWMYAVFHGGALSFDLSQSCFLRIPNFTAASRNAQVQNAGCGSANLRGFALALASRPCVYFGRVFDRSLVGTESGKTKRQRRPSVGAVDLVDSIGVLHTNGNRREVFALGREW